MSRINLKNVDILKRKLDKRRPLDPAALKNLREVYRIEWTYNSNAIEGNTLSLLETKLVVEEGLTIGGKRFKEHLEAMNHVEAIEFVEDIVNRKEELNERVLKQIHHIVLKNIDDKNAGLYRKINVRISGSQHIPPEYPLVQDRMDELFNWYEKNKQLHPLELAAIFHHQFVYIHPFADGNGRTARLLMNFILMSHGFPPAIVKATSESVLKYYTTLEQASVEKDKTPFINFIAGCVEESLENYLRAIGS